MQGCMTVNALKSTKKKEFLQRVSEKQFVWSFLTKTKRDQTLLNHVYGKIWPHCTQFWLCSLKCSLGSAQSLPGDHFQPKEHNHEVEPKFPIDMTWGTLDPA